MPPHVELYDPGAQVPDLALGVIERGGAVVECLIGVLKQLLPPSGDLVGMHAVARGQFGERGIAA